MSESRKTMPPQWKEPEEKLPNLQMDTQDSPKNLSVAHLVQKSDISSARLR
jgi:hypothetical protein